MSETTLQTLAYSLGIEKNIRDMSEAEKAQLRYIQVMKSSTEWQTDMGRTLNQPANALRVLKQQFTLLVRTIGNLFIPILMKSIPYIIAFVEIIKDLAQRIANFFGIEMDFSVDYSSAISDMKDVSAGITDIGDSADKTKNKLNTMLAPFDDLNVVQNQTSSASDGIGGLGGGDLGVDLPEYNALANLSDEFSKNIEKAKDRIKSLVPIVEAVGGAFLTWKISKSVIDFMSWFDKLSTIQKTILRIAAGVIMTIAGVTIKMSGDEDVKNKDTLWKGIAKQLGGSGLIGAGVATLTKNIKIGLAVAGISLIHSGAETISHGDSENFWSGLAETLGGVGLTAGSTFAQTGSVTATLVVTAVAVWSNVGIEISKLKELNPTFEEIMDAIPEIPFIKAFGNMADSVNDFVTDCGNYVGDLIYDSYEDLKTWWSDTKTGFSETWTNVKKAVKETNEQIKNDISDKWDSIKDYFGEKLENIKTDISTAWANIKTNSSSIWDNVKSDLSSKWNDIKNASSETWSNIKNDISDKWNNAKSWLRNNIGSKEDWKQKFNGILEGAGNILQSLKDKFSNWKATLKMPHIKWVEGGFKTSGWIKKALEVLNLPTSLPKLTVDWYEQGGFPQKGELFFANENGASEMIGRIGNQTAVANNDQITTSITNALIAALDQYDFGGGKSPTTIYIGNKKVYEGYGEYAQYENDRYGTVRI